ncbi:MAG: 30S ribosomal protein S5 [SAR324 cluster bacterium]|uniref:Small ribosomal subunit protein uS5 n=1 Tax=SAR324 cluster bacterium TaxID=2024889 RepID=A0A2A4TA97_9DELT|nr:MAG: 30S ribosomal protein S5 [SAR324 cluster bacterium]
MAEKEKSDLIEKVIEVKRVSKVVKGGRRFSFSALVIVGDGKGRVGMGLGKANEVVEAVRKGTETAKKGMQAYSLYKNSIPHVVKGQHGSAKVLMKPSRPGSGIISAGAVRAVAEAVGITDITVKALGSNNKHNLVRSTIDGLAQLKSFTEISERRNKKIEKICLIDF